MINSGHGPSTGPIFPADVLFETAQRSIDRDEAMLNLVSKLIDKVAALEKRIAKMEDAA